MIDRVHPAALVLVAVFFGTVMDAVIKAISVDHALFMIVFWRFVVGAVIVTIPFFLMGKRLPGWEATRFHGARSLIQVIAALLFFYAVSKLELAEVTTLGFTAALMVVPFAWLILGERPRPRAVLAALLGFLGVVVTVWGKPLSTDEPDRLFGIAAVLVSAALYAVILVMLRMRAAKDGAFVIAVYTNVFPAFFMLGPALYVGIMPPLDMVPVFVGFGMLGCSVWILMTLAYGRSEAQNLAPLDYSALIYSTFLGWVFFNEPPRLEVFLGAGLIILACLFVVFDGSARKKRIRLRNVK